MTGWRKTWLFLGITFAVSWGAVGLHWALGFPWDNSLGTMLFAIGYMFVPAGAAVLVQKWICREPLAGPLAISLKPNAWFLVGWFAPFLVAFGALGLALLLPDVTFSPRMEGMIARYGDRLTPEQAEAMRQQLAKLGPWMFPLGVLQSIIAAATVNTVAAFGEELGWRGFLQKELGRLGFWRSSITIGLIWGVWHAPIILRGHNYPQHPVPGAFLMVLFCVLYAPLLSYVRIRTGSSIGAALTHGAINATGGFAILYLSGGNDLTVGITGTAGLVTLLLANAALYLYDRFLSSAPLTGRPAGASTTSGIWAGS